MAAEAEDTQQTTNDEQASAAGCTMSWASVPRGEAWDGFFPFLDQLRADEVVWDEESGAWLVGSFEACRELAVHDGDGWQKRHVPEVERDVYLATVGGGSPRTIVYVEPGETENSEEHARFHRWWGRAFSPRVIETWREQRIRPLVHEHIDRFAGRGTAELFADLAGPVPGRVIAATLGLPTDEDFVQKCEYYRDHTRVARTGPSSVRFLPTDDPVVQHALQAAQEWTDLLMPLVRERRGSDGDDFLAMLWRDAHEFFDPGWDETDILGTVKLMFGAGSYTTGGGIANALYLALARPDLADQVRKGDDDVLTRFVEESLRLYTPALFTIRRATKDLELAGAQIREGDVAVMVNAAANRDPARFECPVDVDLERSMPRGHLAFHWGPRACPGQALARAEIKEAVSAVLTRLPDVRFTPGAEPPLYPGDSKMMVRGWRPLHVTFTPN